MNWLNGRKYSFKEDAMKFISSVAVTTALILTSLGYGNELINRTENALNRGDDEKVYTRLVVADGFTNQLSVVDVSSGNVLETYETTGTSRVYTECPGDTHTQFKCKMEWSMSLIVE